MEETRAFQRPEHGKMKVAVMNGIGKMGFEERPIPVPKDDEVLVKLEYVGICGSDLHYYESGAIGDYVVKPPFVLGHEPGGIIVEEKPADTVNSAKPAGTTSAPTWSFLRRRLWTASFRNTWPMKRHSASSFPTM